MKCSLSSTSMDRPGAEGRADSRRRRSARPAAFLAHARRHNGRQPISADQPRCRRLSSQHGRIPSAVWLGSRPVPPEAYLAALARVARTLLDGKAMPERIEIKPAKLAGDATFRTTIPEAVGLGDISAGFPCSRHDGFGTETSMDAEAGPPQIRARSTVSGEPETIPSL